MRPKKREITVSWQNVPVDSRALADRRTRELVMFYGKNISTLSLQDLVSSAYLQGISDMFDFSEKTHAGIGDFQI